MTALAHELIEREKRERTGYLELGNCGLTELPDLSELEWLETLIVSNRWWDEEKRQWVDGMNTGERNRITTSPIHSLPTGLRKVILGGDYYEKWLISDGRFLEKLTGLTTLYLRYNEIRDWQFLEELTGLTNLYLNYSKISDWRFLEKLTGLTTLDLSYSPISDWRFLEKLTGLTVLHLRSNQISDGRFLKKLTGLTSLDLSSNQISDGRFLEKLTGLTTLYLNSNQISDGRFLENLRGLTTLDLRYNKIRDIEPLRPLIKKGVTTNLKDYGGQGISLDANPLTHPPLETVAQGNVAILEYFRQKEQQGARPLLEAKLVLLGDGRAGKTSLASRLLRQPLPTEADRTQGVDIIIGEYHFPVGEGDFKLHIWDFAGQDKYKPLHQFFYTEGAVYVMVADSGNTKTDFNDWLQTADLFGEGSPLVLALNEFREGMGYGSFDEERWREQFPKLLREVHLVNLLSEQGFPALEKCIQYHAEQLSHSKVEYPNNWADIRAELERRRGENYISREEFFNICRENKLPERDSALILSGILHRIGVCLHYQKSELLSQHVILKNEWATQAVYKILEDQQVAEVKKGFFDWADLRRIWAEDSYAGMRPQLLELMQQFKMAYPLPQGKEFVTPPLLPPAPPADWELPASPSTIEMLVEYKFLPKALMTQFIVSRHADIDRGRTLVWRNGAVLRWSADTLAEVKAFKSRGRDAFYIRSQGHERRGLLTAILKTLRELHSEYKGIEAYEIVPCPCSVCRTKQEESQRHFFDFANLQNRLEKGRRTVECDKSLEEVDLLQLMGDLLVFQHLGVGQRVVLGEVRPPVGSAGATQSRPGTQTPPQTLRIFLASSEELAEERKQLRQFLSERNDRFQETGRGIYLKLENWEAMSSAMSATRKQDDYNRRVLESDVFICLAHTKVGRYTEEEFDVAWAAFQQNEKPRRILTFFKTDGVDPLSVQPSLAAFHKKLSETLRHFPEPYAGYAALEGKVWKELEAFLDKM